MRIGRGIFEVLVLVILALLDIFYYISDYRGLWEYICDNKRILVVPENPIEGKQNVIDLLIL